MNFNKVDAILTKTFHTLASAEDFRSDYEDVMECIPTGRWLKCGEIANEVRRSTQKVSALLNRLVANGYADKRTVNDGIQPYEVMEWAPLNIDLSIPAEIPVYDKDGNYVCNIRNPKFCAIDSNFGYRKITKYKEMSHSEFYVHPLD